MQITKLTESEKIKLKGFKIPFRNTLSFCLTAIGLVSILLIVISFIDTIEDSLLFTKIMIQWSFPVVFVLITIIWYKIKVMNINHDLKTELKKIGSFSIESKGTEKCDTYSTGDYRASGSSERLYITFENYKYHCSKDEFNTFKEGDSITATISDKSNYILSVKGASVNMD